MFQDCLYEYSDTEKRERVTDVCIIQHRGQYPDKQDEPDECIQLSPPRVHKRTADPRNLGPIKREDGHSQPRVHAEQLVDDDVVRGCPAYERKYRERLEKITCSENRQLSGLRTGEKERTRQKEEEKTSHEHDNEMLIPRHRTHTPSHQHTNATTSLLCAGGTALRHLFIIFAMQRLQQRTQHQILRPHHTSRPNQKFSTQPRESKPRQLRRKQEQELEPVVHAKPIVHLRGHNRVNRIWNPCGDIGHHAH
jgi:hypothetical protein